MNNSQPIFTCECGFLCYSEEQVDYHKSGDCKAIRCVVGVMQARERVGNYNHEGLRVGNKFISKTLGDSNGFEI